MDTNDDTVKAQIIPVDLYSIIQREKVAQVRLYGNLCLATYQRKKEALMRQKPQKHLEENRLAREIARVLLASGRQIHISGKEGRNAWEGSARFLNYSDENIAAIIGALIKEDGLLEVNIIQQRSVYCFESELIIKPGIRCPNAYMTEFKANKELRAALAKMLSPFSEEKPQYALPTCFKK